MDIKRSAVLTLLDFEHNTMGITLTEIEKKYRISERSLSSILAGKKQLPGLAVNRIFYKYFAVRCRKEINHALPEGWEIPMLKNYKHPLELDGPEDAPQSPVENPEPKKENAQWVPKREQVGVLAKKKEQPEEHEPKENTMAFYMKYNCSTYKELEEKSKNQ